MAGRAPERDLIARRCLRHRRSIVREQLWNNRRADHGPFDIIGDVHGCADELETLLALLGYVRDENGTWTHAADRKVVIVGELVDRGPRVPDVLRIAMSMVAAGSALAVPGNHDMKLVKKLRGRDVQVTHGLAESWRSSRRSRRSSATRSPSSSTIS